VVLPAGNGETFEFKGEQVIFSAKRQLEYENKDIDMCIFWDKNADLIPERILWCCMPKAMRLVPLHLR